MRSSRSCPTCAQKVSCCAYSGGASCACTIRARRPPRLVTNSSAPRHLEAEEFVTSLGGRRALIVHAQLAPPLYAQQDTFWAHVGQDRELRMYFQTAPRHLEAEEFVTSLGGRRALIVHAQLTVLSDVRPEGVLLRVQRRRERILHHDVELAIGHARRARGVAARQQRQRGEPEEQWSHSEPLSGAGRMVCQCTRRASVPRRGCSPCTGMPGPGEASCLNPCHPRVPRAAR